MSSNSMISLPEAAAYLGLLPKGILHSTKEPLRSNGGSLLKTTLNKGDSYFDLNDLKTFSDDLEKPWISDKAEKRPPIPKPIRKSIESEAAHVCGLCRSPYSVQIAHIIPWADCQHHHPKNLLLLCSKCHGGYDTEKRIPMSAMLRAKEDLAMRFRAALSGKPFDVAKLHDSTKTMYSRILEILDTNRVIFDAFGPYSELAKTSMAARSVTVWNEKRAHVLIPNNDEIIKILGLLSTAGVNDAEFISASSRFKAHVESYKSFVFETNDVHKYLLFPTDFPSLIAQRCK